MYMSRQRASLPINWSGIENSLNILLGIKSAIGQTINEASGAKAALSSFSGAVATRTKEFLGNIDILHKRVDTELSDLIKATTECSSQLRVVDSRLDSLCTEAALQGLGVMEDEYRYIALPSHFEILSAEERDRLTWILPDYQYRAQMLVTEGGAILSEFRYKCMNICLLAADYGFVDEASRIYHSAANIWDNSATVFDFIRAYADEDIELLDDYSRGLAPVGVALSGLSSGYDQYKRDILRPELTQTQRTSRVVMSSVVDPATSLGVDKAVALLGLGTIPAFLVGLLLEAAVMPVVENQITKFNDVIIDGTFSAEDLIYMHPAGETLLSDEATTQEKTTVLALGALCPLLAGYYQLNKNADDEREAKRGRMNSLTRGNIEDMEYSAP